VRNPGVVWNIFRRCQHTSDAFYYDARLTQPSSPLQPSSGSGRSGSQAFVTAAGLPSSFGQKAGMTATRLR
jgi:hypothetical protein